MRAHLTGLLAALACSGCRAGSTEQEPGSKAALILSGREEKSGPKDPSPPGIYDFDLNAPTDASTADLEASAKAMTDRATSYGYKGITSRVIKDATGVRIRVSCGTSMTQEMRKKLRLLGVVNGQRPEIRLPYYETKAESEQKLYSSEKNTAPQGTKWYRSLDNSAYPRLLQDSPVLSPPNLRGPKMSPSGSFTYEADQGASWGGEKFLVDGEIVDVLVRSEMGKSSAVVFSFREDSGTLGHCLKYPMPLRLTPSRAFNRDGSYNPYYERQ